MRNDTQQMSVIGKPKVIRVLFIYVGVTNRFQNSGSSLNDNQQTNTHFPPNGSPSHLRSNPSQHNAHEKRNGNYACEGSLSWRSAEPLLHIRLSDVRKGHKQDYRGNRDECGNAKSDSLSPPQFKGNGSSRRKKQAEEDVSAVPPHEGTQSVSQQEQHINLYHLQNMQRESDEAVLL